MNTQQQLQLIALIERGIEVPDALVTAWGELVDTWAGLTAKERAAVKAGLASTFRAECSSRKVQLDALEAARRVG